MGRAILLILCVCLLTLACGQNSDTVDWLERGKRAKARAIANVDAGKIEAAVVILQEFVELVRPVDIAADDARVVMQTTLELLGRFELALNRPQSALQRAHACLAEGLRTDVFTARCWALRGMAYEQLREARLASDAYLEAQRLYSLLLEKLTMPSRGSGAEQ